MKFNTKTIHAGQHPEVSSGAVMPPIFQTSTFAQRAPGEHQGYEYARVHNPTRTALEKLLAGLENAKDGIAFASGLAAMDGILRMLRPGNHVIASDDLYGGSYRLFTSIFAPMGIEFSFLNFSDLESIESAITSKTKLLWIETPTNPLLKVVDLAGACNLAKKHSLISVVDNTFASPYLQTPLDLGATAVVHSTTKYIGGHSDVIGGVVCTNDDALAEHLRFQIKAVGAAPGPMDCYLILRGAKTLAVRVQRACENAREIAHHLAKHPKAGNVLWPGFEHHPGHEFAKVQMRDFGAMVSFSLSDDSVEKGKKFMSETKVFTLAESLGGVESLISHPTSMTHGSIPPEVRRKAGLNDSLIRLSVGIEDVEDLIADLDQAFKVV